MATNGIDVGIRFSDEQLRYVAGETVSGIADVILPKETPLSALTLTFEGTTEVKWIEEQTSHYYHNNDALNFDKDDFIKQSIPFNENDVTVIDDVFNNKEKKRLAVAFSFVIPTHVSLPSSMVSSYGFIKYQVRLSVQTLQADEPKSFIREIFIEAPPEKNLMITVVGTTEKNVLLHSGKVSMHASLGRKGFTPGETVNVYINVDNQTNTHVTPRVTFHQVQTFICDSHQKTIESDLSKEPAAGELVAAHTNVKDSMITVQLPGDELVSIKTDLITVKYFLRVTLDIPHSTDLHINLPVVIISKKVFSTIKAGFGRDEEQI